MVKQTSLEWIRQKKPDWIVQKESLDRVHFNFFASWRHPVLANVGNNNILFVTMLPVEAKGFDRSRSGDQFVAGQRVCAE